MVGLWCVSLLSNCGLCHERKLFCSAVMYQVCLAGVGSVEGEVCDEEVEQLMGEIVNSDLEYKVEGGRWLV